MAQHRKDLRLEVNIPIVCEIENMDDKMIISSMGEVKNLSIGGMRIALPICFSLFKTRLIEYYLKLPQPFIQIQGRGVVRWAYWDETSQCTTFGLEFSPLESYQKEDIEIILKELAGNNPARQSANISN